MRARTVGCGGERQASRQLPLKAGLIPSRRCGAVHQVVALGMEPQQQVGGPRQAGAAAGGREGGRHEPGLGDGVPVDLQVDSQPLQQVGDSRKLTAQRFGQVAQPKPTLGARQVQPPGLLEQLLDRGHQLPPFGRIPWVRLPVRVIGFDGRSGL
jgi:hypothetical protein